MGVARARGKFMHPTMALNRLSLVARSWLPSAARASSWWSAVEMGPPDAIFGLVEAHKKDPRPNRVSLAIGAYRDEEGKPFVLPTVRKAEKIILEKQLDKEYAGMMGYDAFRKAAAELALGADHPSLQGDKYVATQTVSGTGALYIIGKFLAKFYPAEKTVYLPNPSWPNHGPIFRNCGLEVNSYCHYDPSTRGFNATAAYKDLKSIPNKSIVLFHASGHNPTGVDLKIEEWAEVSRICREKQHFIVVDMAYQGFATGELDKDAAGLRLLARDGHQMAFCQSFAKNMGLYGERVGAMTILCGSAEEAKVVESQLKILIRPLYSNPPINGARIAMEILSRPELYNEWLGELRLMAGRIMSMRARLKESLVREGSTKDWSHITEQIGMFCYTGLNSDLVETLKEEHGIYMTKDGRLSVVSLTEKNVNYVAKALHTVTK